MSNAGFSISVIDDDESVRRAVQRLLRSAGFSATVFASAEEFLSADSGAGCGCLILDVRMPGLSGLELQHRLRQAGSTVPIILITSHEDPQVRDRALAAGAVAFLQKPFDEKSLLNAVAAAHVRER